MRGIRIICCVLLLVLACPCALGEGVPTGVQWTGLEWNGSTDGKYPNRNCDIVGIGREAPRADAIPYDTLADAGLRPSHLHQHHAKVWLFTETWGMHTRKDKTVKSSKKR